VAKSIEIKVPDDIEYRVLGNAFGLLIVSAGLLAGEMIHMRSFAYWLDDIVPLLLFIWLGFRLYRNFLLTVAASHDESRSSVDARDRMIRETLRSEPSSVAQITAKTGYTAEQVVEEVARRIEAKKEESMRKLMRNS
jgi:hypothetical protein